MSKRFYLAQPEIKWEKVLCPICGAGVGPDSTCYAQSNGQPALIQHPTLGALPVMSEECIYRKSGKLWVASVNYPVSKVLIDRLKPVAGVDKIYPLSTYKFQIAIGDLFNEDAVKRDLTVLYRTLFKELSVQESSRTADAATPIPPTPIGVVLPNGKRFLLPSGVDPALLGAILTDVPGTLPIDKLSKKK